MAIISANLPLNAGDTGLTLLLYSLTDGSLLNAGGDAMTEVANGFFQATVDDSDIPADEDVRADARDASSNVIASDILYSGSTLVGIQSQASLVDDVSDAIGAAGSRAVTITVTDGSANVPNAPVQLMTAADVAIGVVRYTNSSGELVLNIEDGSYKLLVGMMTGYAVHAAEAFTVTAVALTKTLTVTPDSAVVGAADPALCNVLVKVLNQYGSPLEGATVTAKIEAPDFLLNTVVSNDMTTTATTDASGEVTLSLIRAVEFIRGGKYQILIKVGTSTQKFEYYVPNQSSVVATFTS